MRIHKVVLPPSEGVIKLDVPYKAVALSVANQAGQLAIWYMFDEKTLDITTAYVRIVFTGKNFQHKENMRDIGIVRFLGTVLFNHDGDYVLHVFTENF